MKRIISKRQALESKRRRIRKQVIGSAERPRLAAYRSEKHTYTQLIDDVAGHTLASASSRGKDLRDALKDQRPLETAKAVGESLAEKAKAAGVERVVFDRGGRKYAGRIAALAEGARGKGLQF